MKEKYYVVSMDEDGEWHFAEHTTLDTVISDYGIDEPEADYNEGEHPAYGFKTSIDDYTPGQVLIRGTILVPKPKKVVEAWDFEEAE